MRETMDAVSLSSGDGPSNFLDLERGRVVVAMGANERRTAMATAARARAAKPLA